MTNNKRKTESEFYIKKRNLGQLFDNNTPLKTDLYRGQKPEDRTSPLLHPILKDYLLSNGKTRYADMVPYSKNGEPWVSSAKGGVSLFDIIGTPVASWDYYKIASGTTLPLGLVIVRDKPNPNLQKNPTDPIPVHYSIRPHWDMPLKGFLILLDELVSSFTRVK